MLLNSINCYDFLVQLSTEGTTLAAPGDSMRLLNTFFFSLSSFRLFCSPYRSVTFEVVTSFNVMETFKSRAVKRKWLTTCPELLIYVLARNLV